MFQLCNFLQKKEIAFCTIYIFATRKQHALHRAPMSVEDDDAMFAELIKSCAHDATSSDSDSGSSKLAPSVLDFITKNFGSVTSFYGRQDTAVDTSAVNGFTRIRKLRQALNVLDANGWERSYHQRVFHENFLNAVVRVLFKKDPPGSFEKAYPRLLEQNNWTCITQEILISTPRRFGKTISVCLFVAALLFACPSIEISIYSTCKRISGKLLRNCTRFLTLICDGLKIPELPYIKQSQDEVELQGPESKYDTRRLNSYPSKVSCVCFLCTCACLQARNPLVCTRFVVGSYLFVKKSATLYACQCNQNMRFYPKTRAKISAFFDTTIVAA